MSETISNMPNITYKVVPDTELILNKTACNKSIFNYKKRFMNNNDYKEILVNIHHFYEEKIYF